VVIVHLTPPITASNRAARRGPWPVAAAGTLSATPPPRAVHNGVFGLGLVGRIVGAGAQNAGMDLAGLTAVVTGGAAGIGGGIAERLAAEGMHVVIADLDENAGAAAATRIGGSFVRADIATTAGVRAAIDTAGQRPGRIGVLVNNAGGVEGPGFPAAGPAAWEHTLDLNLRAVMLASQLVLAPMADHGGGAIINIASVAGLGTTSHDSPEYAVAKAGVVRFTACLAPLRDTMGVRANCICPGLVDTPASQRTRARMTPAQLAALPPVLTPADIADAAMTFLTDDALAGRIMVCRGGEPSRLLPVIDWQTV
jgi:NAD(P)-dependent dehydrogenase (short-subunit alcohol dehydrogenase family)